MATQCGDLLAAHGLPPYRTMGRDRSLTLVYSSATAAPRPTVAAWVTVPNYLIQPDSLYAELKIGTVVVASSWYYGWANAVKQLVLAVPGDTLATGVYPFTVLVRHKYPGGVYDTMKTGELLVVNRRNSVFGAGWWLGGVEQLTFSLTANRVMWLGADGSSAIYDSVASGVWRRAAGGFRDTLVRFDSSGTWYRRTLRHRIKVTYDNSGRHVRTTNRIGHSTRFYWTTNLDSIVVPPDNTVRTRYTLAYSSGRLDRMTDPVGRVLDVTVASDTTLTFLMQPDSQTVDFLYDSSKRIIRRNNPRSNKVFIAYV